MGKFSNEIIKQNLSKIDKTWFEKISEVYNTLPFLDESGFVFYHEEIPITHSDFEDEKSEIKFQEVDLDFNLRDFAFDNKQIYSNYTYIFNTINLENIKNYPEFEKHERIKDITDFCIGLYRNLSIIGDKISYDKIISFLTDVIDEIEIQIIDLKEKFENELYHDLLDDLASYTKKLLINKYKLQKERASFTNNDSPKLQLEMNLSALSALAYYLIHSNYVDITQASDLHKILSRNFKAYLDGNKSDITASQIARQMSKITSKENGSAGLKNIIREFDKVFETVIEAKK